MSNALRSFIRTVTILLLAAGAAGSLITVFYVYVMSPRIELAVPAGSTVEIRNISSGQIIATQRNVPGSTVLRVTPGYYRIGIATINGSKRLRYSSIGYFQKKIFTFSSYTPLQSELVYREAAYSAIQNGALLDFLDPVKRMIMQIDGNGQPSTLDGIPVNGNIAGNAQAQHPIAGNRAVVLSADKLYVLDSRGMTPINMDGLPATRGSLAIGTNQTQSSFVVASDTSLYLYSSVDAEPVKVLTLSKQADQLAYGGNRVVAYSTRMPDAKENIRAAYSAYAIDPIVADVGAHTQRILTNGPIVSASVSPDGKLATIGIQGSINTTLYDLSRSHSIYTIEDPDTTTPVWIDSIHFIYGKRSEIWKIDTTTRTGDAIATLPDGLQATSITYDSGKQTYLVTTYNDADSASIYRLTTTAPSQDASKAAALDTSSQNNPQFLLTYINILNPTLRITTNVVLNNPSLAQFNSATVQSRQAAISYLQQQGINTNNIRIVYDPSDL